MLSERAIVDAYTRRALLLLRVGGGLGEEAIAELAALARDLRGVIAGADLSSLGKRDMAALLRDIETAIDDAFARIAEAQQTRLDELGDTEAAWAADAFGTRHASAPALAAVLANLLVLGYPLAKLWQRQGAGLADRLGATLRTAAAMGTAPADMLAAIFGQGPRGRERGGLFEQARTQAATLADTSVHAAAYAARQVAWKAGGIQYLKWHSILDHRTTIGCAVRAGKLYTLDFQPVGHDIPIDQPPPRHWNCRSILVPMSPDFAPPGDGQDPYTESLDAWLKRQPENVQDELLGPTRAALWRAGTIDARGLLGRGGETLSVAELTALDTSRSSSVRSFVREAETSTVKQPALALGKVPPSLGIELEGIGLRGNGKVLALDHDNTRHILRKHGSESERLRGQAPITGEDFALLPDILAQRGALSRGDPPMAKDGAPLVEKRSIFNGFLYVVTMKIRRNDVTVYTMYKRSQK